MKITKENLVSTINRIWLSNCFLWWTLFIYYFFKENQNFEIAIRKSLTILPYIWYILGLSILFWIVAFILTFSLNFFLIVHPEKRKQKRMEKEMRDKTLSEIAKDFYERERIRHSN